MNSKLWTAANALYLRQLSSRNEMLNEMLRVKTVLRNLDKDSAVAEDKEGLFQLMKRTTEDDCGFFPADRNDFFDIFQALKDIDPIEFTLWIFKDDRAGTVPAPSYLGEFVAERIRTLLPRKILITEAEKHLSTLRLIVSQFPDLQFTLTTQLKPMKALLDLAFDENDNVSTRFESIYTQCLMGEKFDYIHSLPDFGGKVTDSGVGFMTRDPDGVALENMLYHLDDRGTLDIIVPAKVTFSRLGYDRLRTLIAERYGVRSIYILPEGTFRPTTAIKTYYFTITGSSQHEVKLGTFKLDGERLDAVDEKVVPMEEFLSHEDWRIELFLAEDNESVRLFKESDVNKVKLKDVAEVFRGKSILKKDIAPGNTSVLNISNINNGEIDFSDMDTIDEEERKIKRYQLQTGDVVLSSRGTAIKLAVFKDQNRSVVASANLIVIRPKESVHGEFVKIFLESPIGLAIIRSFQRGTAVMNINYLDIAEMEIPLLPISDQEKLVAMYNIEFDSYKEAINQAEDRWNQIKQDIYRELV